MAELLSAASASVLVHHLPFAVHGVAHQWPAVAAAVHHAGYGAGNPYGPYPCCICEAINETLWFAWDVITCPVHFFFPCFCGPMVAVASVVPFLDEDYKTTSSSEEIGLESKAWTPLRSRSHMSSLLDEDDGVDED
jgi:hypothetical protein